MGLCLITMTGLLAGPSLESDRNPMKLTLIPALSDNYIYLLSQKDWAIVIDPAEADSVLSALEEQKLHLRAILNTHHHSDHIGGNHEIKKQTECSIIAPETKRIPEVDEVAHEGKDISFNHLHIQVISVPGHTTTHVAFYLPEEGWLFSGDSLFAGGCGRLFEGTPEQMHHSLEKLAKLPGETKVYCGHEYTEKNLLFALSLEPENRDIKTRLEKVQELRKSNLPSLPSTIEEEKRTNPFLRSGTPELKRALGMEEASDLEVFTKVRSLKDDY